MKRWKVQDAKARFFELLASALREGPQLVTRRGQDVAVLVSITEWARLQCAPRSPIKSLLLDGPCFEEIAPARGLLKRRGTK